MGSILPETSTFDPQVVVPNPGEFVRAGGGTGTAIDITGAAGDPNGTITYTSLTTDVRIRQINNGASLALVVTVSGNDITVQLATDMAGNTTSTAASVAAQVNSVASALVGALPRGTGSGLAGTQPTFINISAGLQGSVRPPYQELTNRTRFLYDHLASTPAYLYSAPLYISVNAVSTTTTVTLAGTPPFIALDAAGTPQIIAAQPETILDHTNLDIGMSFANDTWYYIYGTATAGSIFKISTNIPFTTDTNPNFTAGVWETSSPDQGKYVGSFRTDSSAHIIPFSKSGREYRFQQPRNLYTAVGATGNASYALDVNNKGGCSPISRNYSVRVFAYNANSMGSQGFSFSSTNNFVAGTGYTLNYTEGMMYYINLGWIQSGGPITNPIPSLYISSTSFLVQFAIDLDGYTE